MAFALPVQTKYMPWPGCGFHEVHGIGITLSNSGHTARRRDAIYNAVVMSEKPLPRNSVFEVQVDEIDNSQDSDLLYVGVMTKDPCKIDLTVSARSNDYAIVISPSESVTFQAQVPRTGGQRLGSVKEGSRIGVMVETEDSENFLHVLVDGKVLFAMIMPKFSRDVEFYALFDLGWRVKQVTVKRPHTHFDIDEIAGK